MDEIEYKLNTNNSVLVVNAIEKLICTIKNKFKPEERQRFVLDNEELKFLRNKCSAKKTIVSLTACQGLLALVECGVLEIPHTMSTVITLLPSAHNYSNIISTIGGLLILDLRSRLLPGQPYSCQFSLKSPQHPLITVLEKKADAAEDVLTQMHAICTHPDYTISSNSLELLSPVFLWMTCNPQRSYSIRPWQLLLSLHQNDKQPALLLKCLSGQQTCNPNLIEPVFSAYSAVTEAMLYQQNSEFVIAVLPVLARISNELIKHGRNPLTCYSLIERCFSSDWPGLQAVAAITVPLLAENLSITCALHLHQLFNLCLHIISKYECPSISLNMFIAYSLQWLHLPSCLTKSALKVAAKILEIYRNRTTQDTRLHMPNLQANRIFQTILNTDKRLAITFRLLKTWERIKDDQSKLKLWFEHIGNIDDVIKLELIPFLLGITMEKKVDNWFEDFVIKALIMVVNLMEVKKDLSSQLLPVLVYKIANDFSPRVKLECLKCLPMMAKNKENVPSVVSIMSALSSSAAVPTSTVIHLHTRLVLAQVRCFPYLQQLLAEVTTKPGHLKWETEIARAISVRSICEERSVDVSSPSTNPHWSSVVEHALTLPLIREEAKLNYPPQGLELVSIISSTLNRCTSSADALAAANALESLRPLWRQNAVAPISTWRALERKLAGDRRPAVCVSISRLLGEVPLLRVPTPEYDRLIADAARQLWGFVAGAEQPEVIAAAAEALAGFKIDQYTLKDVPEIYRKTVKLPAAYCKTPADAARKPEDVLDYIPCVIWPEVFKYTNQAALPAVSSLVARLIDVEIRAYRSGVYAVDARSEPENTDHLSAYSVLRGVADFVRKQATSPTYDCPDAVLLSMVQTLAAPLCRPLPPFSLWFLHSLFPRGRHWRRPTVLLAAKQANASSAARAMLVEYLGSVEPGTTEDSEIIMVFELLPHLCRTMPPNSVRVPVEKCLTDAYANTLHANKDGRCKDGGDKDGGNKDGGDKDGDDKELFATLIDLIGECLQSDKIHDANRTLLSQIVENYFGIVTDDNVAWPSVVKACCALSTKYIERMTSPLSWWEVSAPLLRKACAVRSALAAADCTGQLTWLNEIVDAAADCTPEHESTLLCMVPALKSAQTDSATRDWVLQLLARIQVQFAENQNESAKAFLCDVFTLSIVVISGLWSFEPDTEGKLVSSRELRLSLLPAAIASLFERDGWRDCAPQMVEWLCHTRDAAAGSETSRACHRSLLALRHCDHFTTSRAWMKVVDDRRCH